MACNITITGISGHESQVGQGITRIIVTGSAQDCQQVCVTVQQTQGVDFTTPERSGDVDANGEWSVEFNAPADFQQSVFKCGRDNKWIINAHCCADPRCKAERSDSLIRCGGGCPTAAINVAAIDATTQCNANGTRTITVTANVDLQGATAVALSLSARNTATNAPHFGPSEAMTANGQFPAQPWQAELAPGDYEVQLQIVLPQGCSTITENLTVPACPAQRACPQVDWDSQKDCNASRQRMVSVTAVITADPSISYSAQLRDETNTVVASGNSAGGNLTLQAPSQQRAPGTYQYKVTFSNLPADLHDCDDTNTFEVVACGAQTDPPPKVDPPIVTPPDVTIDLCFIMRMLFLLGLGFALLGLVLLMCPMFSWFVDPTVNAIVGGIMLGVGLLVFVVFFLIWLFVCRPNACDFILLLWQILALAGAVITYAGFCPGCQYLLLGAVFLVAAFGAFVWWVFGCRPPLCRMYLELFAFILFVVDVVAMVEIILGGCVLTTVWYMALIWAGALIGLKALAFAGLRRNNCTVGF